MGSRTTVKFAAAPLLLAASLSAQAAGSPALSTDEVVTRVIRAEAQFTRDLSRFRPVIETYLQFMHQTPNHKNQISGDAYFIGRLQGPELNFETFAPEKSSGFYILSFLKRLERFHLFPAGFARMTMLDPDNFDQSHYIFENMHGEFVGEVRCVVLDVRPRDKEGRFVGRFWAEDRDFHIVRYSG